MPEYVFPRIRENMFDGKVKKLWINGLVSKSFPGKKHVRIQRGGGGGAGGQNPPPPEKSQTYDKSGLDPLKKRKATKPEFNVGPLAARTRNAI